MTTKKFQYGDTILYRGIEEHHQICDVRPVIVIEDSDTQIVLYLPIDTPSKKPVLLNHKRGTPRRWTKDNWRLEDAVWKWSEMLIIVKPDQQRATLVRWSIVREFQGWYVNMQSKLVRTRLGFDHRDHQLDILVDPNFEWRWKDEEELELCVEDGRFTPQEADEIREEGLRAITEIEQKAGPFADGWENWQPKASSPRPTIPPDWQDLSMYDT